MELILEVCVSTISSDVLNSMLVEYVRWVCARIEGEDILWLVCELGDGLVQCFGLDVMDLDILWVVVVGEVDLLLCLLVCWVFFESSFDGFDGVMLVRILISDVGW